MVSNISSSFYVMPFEDALPSELSRGKCGIYVLENAASKMSYIGSSRNIYKRFHQPRGNLRKGIHANMALQAAYEEFGEDSFVFVIAELCGADVVSSIEDVWLAKHYRTGTLYNLHMTATYEGNTFSQETRRKISEGLKARWAIPGAREEIARKLMGTANGAKPFRLMAPDGVIHVGINREEFCRRIGVSGGQIADVVTGKRAQAHGWRLPEPHPECTAGERPRTQKISYFVK